MAQTASHGMTPCVKSFNNPPPNDALVVASGGDDDSCWLALVRAVLISVYVSFLDLASRGALLCAVGRFGAATQEDFLQDVAARLLLEGRVRELAERLARDGVFDPATVETQAKRLFRAALRNRTISELRTLRRRNTQEAGKVWLDREARDRDSTFRRDSSQADSRFRCAGRVGRATAVRIAGASRETWRSVR